VLSYNHTHGAHRVDITAGAPAATAPAAAAAAPTDTDGDVELGAAAGPAGRGTRVRLHDLAYFVVDEARPPLQRLLTYDLACFLACSACGAGLLLDAQLRGTLAAGWQFRAALAGARIGYSLCALPFFFASLPPYDAVFTHARATGYTTSGACVPKQAELAWVAEALRRGKDEAEAKRAIAVHPAKAVAALRSGSGSSNGGGSGGGEFDQGGDSEQGGDSGDDDVVDSYVGCEDADGDCGPGTQGSRLEEATAAMAQRVPVATAKALAAADRAHTAANAAAGRAGSLAEQHAPDTTARVKEAGSAAAAAATTAATVVKKKAREHAPEAAAAAKAAAGSAAAKASGMFAAVKGKVAAATGAPPPAPGIPSEMNM